MTDIPNCRICGKNDNVGQHWPESPQNTICVFCCEKAEHEDGETGHQFSYEPSEGHMCNYCGIHRNDASWEYWDVCDD